MEDKELTPDQIRQMEFVKGMLGCLEGRMHYIINAKGKVPAEWEGIELLQYMADYMAECNCVKMQRGRKISYNNTRMVNGF